MGNRFFSTHSSSLFPKSNAQDNVEVLYIWKSINENMFCLMSSTLIAKNMIFTSITSTHIHLNNHAMHTYITNTKLILHSMFEKHSRLSAHSICHLVYRKAQANISSTPFPSTTAASSLRQHSSLDNSYPHPCTCLVRIFAKKTRKDLCQEVNN